MAFIGLWFIMLAPLVRAWVSPIAYAVVGCTP